VIVEDEIILLEKIMSFIPRKIIKMQNESPRLS